MIFLDFASGFENVKCSFIGVKGKKWHLKKVPQSRISCKHSGIIYELIIVITANFTTKSEPPLKGEVGTKEGIYLSLHQRCFAGGNTGCQALRQAMLPVKQVRPTR